MSSSRVPARALSSYSASRSFESPQEAMSTAHWRTSERAAVCVVAPSGADVRRDKEHAKDGDGQYAHRSEGWTAILARRRRLRRRLTGMPVR